MKTKNPLYVVKGKTVEEATGLVDLFLKKFNLGPAVQIFTKIVTFLLAQVKDYPTFLVVKKFVDEVVEKIQKLQDRFGRA